MDGSRFDDLTRSLAGGTSRRGFVAGLAALAAGLGGRAAVGAACPPGQVGVRGVCVCKTTGRPPDATGFCPCPSGQIRCRVPSGWACVDPAKDVNHCGACDAACAAGASVAEVVCRQGSCRVKSCAPGLANCDGDLVCETTLGTDTDCAACGDACTGTGQTCGGGGQAGGCGCTDDGTACAAALCGTATNNCGATVSCGPLGGACPQVPGQACAGGACVCNATSCPTGCCDAADFCQPGTELGACGPAGGVCAVCPASAVCAGGSCAGTVLVATNNGPWDLTHAHYNFDLPPLDPSYPYELTVNISPADPVPPGGTVCSAPFAALVTGSALLTAVIRYGGNQWTGSIYGFPPPTMTVGGASLTNTSTSASIGNSTVTIRLVSAANSPC